MVVQLDGLIMNDGFIKLQRNPLITDLAIHDPTVLTILIVASQRAAWTDNPVTGLKAGEAYIGFKDLKLTRSQFREGCKRLLTYGFAAIKTTSRGTTISLNNHGFAQFGDGLTASPTASQPPANRQPTATNKEVKKLRSKEKNIPPPLGEVVSYFQAKGKSPAMANEFFDYYESNGWKVGKNLMKKWKNAASGWISRQRDQAPGISMIKKSDNELLRLCNDKGIRTHGLRREELIAKLGVPA